MKQLELTPTLKAKIKAAVGEDVDVNNFAVFEAIALNTVPLPGKRGSIFESAVATPLTLTQMADYLNNGNHIPLISDHELMGTPKGRVFSGEVLNADAGHTELRTLFYLDATEDKLIEKLNAGSLDEVSVSFLSSQLLCSECSFDYMGEEATYENLRARTCSNGHTIGTDGVHVRMVGLNQFIELSLVARGAASKPKIIGKSQSKLQPATAMRLAARGFEVEGLVFEGSAAGEDVVTIDVNKLNADLIAARVAEGTLTASNTALTNQVTTLTASLETANTELAAVRAELQAEKDKAPATEVELTAAKAEAEAGVAFLQTVLKGLLVAAAKDVPDELPGKVAELQAEIEKLTAGLTAVLPIGGKSVTNKSDAGEATKTSFSAFKTNRS